MSELDLETGERRNLVQVLRTRAEVIGDSKWIITTDRSATYDEADKSSNRLAHGLRRFGVSFGETVLILLPNSLDYVYCWVAIAKLGAVEVPLNTAGRGNPLRHQINDSKAKVIIVAGDLVGRLEMICGELSTLTHCIVDCGRESLASIRQRAPLLAQRCAMVELEALFSDQVTAQPRSPSYRDLIAIIYTSGTTGMPKGVMAPHAHAFEYASANATVLDMQRSDIHYAALPLFHVAGQWACLYAAALKGGTVILSDRFSTQTFWPEVARHRATTTFLLGAMASFLYRQPPTAADSATPLKKALICPLIPEVDSFARRFGVRVSTAYGSTELGGCGLFHVLKLPNAASCGKPIDARCEVKIVDDHDERVPAGTIGEMVFRPKEPWTMMQGYWNQPESTAQAWTNLWFHTGDLGRCDEEGNYYFVDRIKDAIRRRGENISSVEIENEILDHPAVLECAVVPVGSADTEQEILAFIVTKEGRSLTAADLVRFLETRVAHFMIPRYIETIEALPKTATGKVQKALMRERGVTANTWDARHGEALG